MSICELYHQCHPLYEAKRELIIYIKKIFIFTLLLVLFRKQFEKMENSHKNSPLLLVLSPISQKRERLYKEKPTVKRNILVWKTS